jgi:hypothetical protein
MLPTALNISITPVSLHHVHYTVQYHLCIPHQLAESRRHAHSPGRSQPLRATMQVFRRPTARPASRPRNTSAACSCGPTLFRCLRQSDRNSFARSSHFLPPSRQDDLRIRGVVHAITVDQPVARRRPRKIAQRRAWPEWRALASENNASGRVTAVRIVVVGVARRMQLPCENTRICCLLSSSHSHGIRTDRFRASLPYCIVSTP